MNLNRNYFVSSGEREALISLTALSFIEEHALLAPEQLQDAKRSLQALFLRASGEEGMLRKLLEMLKATRRIHTAFANISGTLAGVGRCIAVVDGKLVDLHARLERQRVAPPTNAAFVGPFLSFSQEFVRQMTAFADSLFRYLAAREHEARAQSAHCIAMDARERLRQRLSGHLGEARDETETRIKEEVVASFDYSAAEAELRDARHGARIAKDNVKNRLGRIRQLCQPVADSEDDIFARFVAALPVHADLAALEEAILELFRLYRHAHGMFRLDCIKLNRALDTMMDNTDAYFQSKEEERDMAAKRDKLRKIEGLISFLERAMYLAADERMGAYPTFSRQLSAAVSERRAPWSHVAEDLLRAKVQAEADVGARL